MSFPVVVHQPADPRYSAELDEHGFPVHVEHLEKWHTLHKDNGFPQQLLQQEQRVSWDEWPCQPAAAEAARQGGVVLDPEHLRAVSSYCQSDAPELHSISQANDRAANGIPAAYRRTVYALLSHPITPNAYAGYLQCHKLSKY